MVGVLKLYVKREELIQTIEDLLKRYSKLRIEFPSTIEQHFLVKAWERKT